MIRQIIQSIRLYLNRNGKFYGLSISQIGFVPNNKSLYRLALLHKSASKMTSKGVVLNYERLEMPFWELLSLNYCINSFLKRTKVFLPVSVLK